MLLILKAFLTNPKIAAVVAALYVGRPDIADDLIDICQRESRCSPVKTHKIDAHISNDEWWGQTKIGARYRKQGKENMHLDNRCQKRNAKGGWATHGPSGLSAGAQWQYLPPCYQPEDLDNVWISELIAARKYIRECWETNTKHTIRGWCKVRRKSRRNNKPSPRRKTRRKIKRPKSWFEFYMINP